MDAGEFVALRNKLRSVVRECQAQQETLSWQKRKLRDQQLKLLRAVIKLVPDETRNDSEIACFRQG